MSFLHAPALDADAVTTIPPPSLGGRELAMISHVHLATRVEDVKRDEKKVTFVCGPNQKSLEMTEDLGMVLLASEKVHKCMCARVCGCAGTRSRADVGSPETSALSAVVVGPVEHLHLDK